MEGFGNMQQKEQLKQNLIKYKSILNKKYI